MRKIRLLIPLLLGMALSCSKQVETIGSDLLPGDAPEVVCKGISRDVVEISPEDAVKVAMMRGGSEKTKGAATERIVKEVKTISSEDGAANIYAVNYADDKGFTLVSATKNYFPVLAEVESGSFDDGIYETGAAVLLDQYNNDIEYCRTLPEDSLRRFRALWREYEQKNEAKPKVTKDGDALAALISTSFASWRAAGYEIYDLGGGAPEDLPQSVYDSWYSIAEGVANEDYDIDNNAFILVGRNRTTYQKGPLVSTQWGQGSPYNLSTATINGVHPMLGCCAVAMGQLMKYHQYPNTSDYNWSSMPNVLSSTVTTITPLSDFLYEVALSINTNFGVSGSSSTIANVEGALQGTYGYSSDLDNSHNSTNVKNSIISEKPVIMRGDRTDGSSYVGHEWLCDGYKFSNVTTEYILMVISVVEPPLQFETPVNPYYAYEGGAEYYHMNWGHSPDADGWYADGLSSGDANHYYCFNRKELVNITPGNE